MKVTVLGIGIMGAAVSRTLLRAGHEVTAWNRTPERAEPLAADGIHVAGDVADAVRGADAVLLTLFDEAAVLAVMAEGLVAAPQAVWVQASTIGIEGTERVVALAAQHGVSLVEAMMLGTKGPAEQGQLTLLVAGDTSIQDRVAPVLEAISAKIVRVGPEVGQASALKLVTNAWVGAITAATGQSVALAQGLGLDPALFLEAIDQTPVDSRYAHVKGKAMIDESFSPSFTVEGVVKDLDLMIAAAARAGISDQLLATVQGFFRRAGEAGHADHDMAAVVTAFPSR